MPEIPAAYVMNSGTIVSSIISTRCESGLMRERDPLPSHRNAPFMHHHYPCGQ